jgi:two-component sensor histidine kinase
MSWLRTLVTAPTLSSEEATRHARLLHIVLLTQVLALFVSFWVEIVRAVIYKVNWINFGVIIFAAGSIIIWEVLMRRGKVDIASAGMILLFTISVTLIIAASGTIHSPGVVYYPLVVTMATLLINRRAGIIACVMCSILSLGIVIAESNGSLRTPTPPIALLSALHVTVGLSIATVLLNLAIRSLDEALAQAGAKERALQASLQEKEILIKEVHHRVKNNLQVIVSILNLQSSYIQDPLALNVLQTSQNRVRSMALVHEALYRSNNLARIDLQQYLQHLTSTLCHTYASQVGSINLHFEGSPVSLSVDSAIPCGLIVNELISNALKHGLSNQRDGNLLLRLQTLDEGTVELTIADDGVGIPEGTHWHQSDSLGIQLVQSLVKQLKGEIELTRLNPGTQFTMRFKSES